MTDKKQITVKTTDFYSHWRRGYWEGIAMGVMGMIIISVLVIGGNRVVKTYLRHNNVDYGVETVEMAEGENLCWIEFDWEREVKNEIRCPFYVDGKIYCFESWPCFAYDIEIKLPNTN